MNVITLWVMKFYKKQLTKSTLNSFNAQHCSLVGSQLQYSFNNTHTKRRWIISKVYSYKNGTRSISHKILLLCKLNVYHSPPFLSSTPNENFYSIRAADFSHFCLNSQMPTNEYLKKISHFQFEVIVQ